MKHRLCLPDHPGMAAAEPGAEIELGPDRAHYLGRVLRLRPGAPLAVFDGRGSEWRADVVRISGKSARVRIASLLRSEPRPSALVLAQAWLKGSATDTVVQKSVELGVTDLWLFMAERSNVRLDARRLAAKRSHLERVATSAAEQCEALWLPRIEPFNTLSDVLAAQRPGRTLLLDPGNPPPAVGGDPQPLTLLVGPEGGWSEAERRLAGNDPAVVPAGLGPLILRAETAPLAAIAAIRQEWGWRR